MKLFEKASGKFCDGKYVAYYPSLGYSIVKNNPRHKKRGELSETQKNSQERFKRMSLFAMANKFTLIRTIWNKSNIDRLNGYNRFIKYNKHAFNYLGDIVHPELLQLSSGGLPIEQDFCVQRCVNSTNISLQWTNNPSLTTDNKYDCLCYLIYKDEMRLVPVFTDITRAMGHTEILYEKAITKDSLLFLFFRSYDNQSFSRSICYKIRAVCP